MPKAQLDHEHGFDNGIRLAKEITPIVLGILKTPVTAKQRSPYPVDAEPAFGFRSTPYGAQDSLAQLGTEFLAYWEIVYGLPEKTIYGIGVRLTMNPFTVRNPTYALLVRFNSLLIDAFTAQEMCGVLHQRTGLETSLQ